MPRAIAPCSMTRRLGCFGSYTSGREIHLFSSRNPGEMDAGYVLEFLMHALWESGRARGNDNTRAA